jgi:hypothetical protein
MIKLRRSKTVVANCLLMLFGSVTLGRWLWLARFRSRSPRCKQTTNDTPDDRRDTEFDVMTYSDTTPAGERESMNSVFGHPFLALFPRAGGRRCAFCEPRIGSRHAPMRVARISRCVETVYNISTRSNQGATLFNTCRFLPSCILNNSIRPRSYYSSSARYHLRFHNLHVHSRQHRTYCITPFLSSRTHQDLNK